jgi:hypothetical protein
MLLTIDIETIPGQSDEARAIARAETKAPGNLKKPESIEAWWAEHGEAAVEEAWRKQALDPALGELCAIGFACGEESPAVSVVRRLDETERDFLKRAISTMHAAIEIEYGQYWHESRRPFLIGHNTPFDIGFLRARCWANRIYPPHWLPKADARLGRDYGDTMQTFAGYGGRISLSRLCRCLGIPDPKQDGDGRDVLALWKEGQHDALAAYNRADIEAARACWLVMNLAMDCEVI